VRAARENNVIWTAQINAEDLKGPSMLEVLRPLIAEFDMEATKRFIAANYKVLQALTDEDKEGIDITTKELIKLLDGMDLKRSYIMPMVGDLSAYNFSLTNATRLEMSSDVTAMTEAYRSHPNDDEAMVVRVSSLGEMKIQAEAKRMRIGSPKLKIRLAVEGDKERTADEKKAMITANLKGALISMGIDDIIGVNDVTVLTKDEADAQTVEIISGQYEEDVLTIVDTREIVEGETVPKNVQVMKYEGPATAQVSDAALLVAAKREADDAEDSAEFEILEMFARSIGFVLERMGRGIFNFRPIEPVSIELQHELMAYEEVAIRA